MLAMYMEAIFMAPQLKLFRKVIRYCTIRFYLVNASSKGFH